ncbi:uncharacterized protein isoform X2 [Rhodnius prolixus]|uniref:uncharacterized protein isoform X2 n=1 Tax=Rhodnius prolixus TaxID=13249 RepID=UPI003D18815B
MCSARCHVFIFIISQLFNMATCVDVPFIKSERLKYHFLYERFSYLNEVMIKKGVDIDDLRKMCNLRGSKCERQYSFLRIAGGPLGFSAFSLIFIILALPYFDGMMKTVFGVKCVVPNNYLVWEATRPLADCSICSNLSSVIVLPNVTREEFKKYAYSYQPIIVKGAALHWPARKSFNYYFFKEIFNRIEGAHESVEEECQFLKFKTDFASLREVFKMPPGRVKNSKGYKPWYIGWSNCHPEVLKEMRLHYSKPHFLPLNAEHSHVDFIFMGYQQGAFMHLDYITRLMWQAQLRGHKTWRLNPPPECEMVCKSFSFEVFPGDIHTRQWYHDTRIRDGEFSITVSSEYG